MTSTRNGIRRRDAADSRARLLAAASELFAERGYERTTIRDLGERAGLDPTLIARYFGSKSGLYLACIYASRKPAESNAIDLHDPYWLRGLLNRVDSAQHTPALHAAITPHADPELQQAVIEVLRTRMLQPAAEAAHNAGYDDADLRAETAAAAVIGVVLSRQAGALTRLAEASTEKMVELLIELTTALLSGSDSKRTSH